MDLTDLLKIGASMIQNSSNESTSGIDSSLITNALGSILGGNSEEGSGLDLSSIISNVTNGDLGETVSSWIGNGENMPIDTDKVADLIGEDKLEQFASHLNIDLDTAKSELANVLPNLVDQATNEDESLAGSLLEKVGGISGAMEMAGKLFNR